jgi:hypothetical protein
MMQPSLSLLTLTIREATDFIGSVRTTDAMPDRLRDGFIDMMLAALDCFPDAADEFERLEFRGGRGFNHAEEAFRLLSPLVDQVTYPLHTEHGIMLEDTPLVMALAPGSAMHLLEECLGLDEHLDYEPDANALFDMTRKMIDAHPSIAAVIDKKLDEDPWNFHFYADSYPLLKEAAVKKEEAMKADQPQLAMVA